MAIAVKCECGRQFRARDEHAGKRTKCPGCYRQLRVEGDHLPNHDVFISYSNKDRLVADAVCATLEAHKLRCWMAPRDIRAGMDWGAAIIDAIADSAVLVLLFTANSNQSPQVLREIERAVSKGVAVVPLRLEDTPLSKSMEYFISASHWLDAMTPPLEQHLAVLGEIVARLVKERERSPLFGTAQVPAGPALGQRSRRRLVAAMAGIAGVAVLPAWLLRPKTAVPARGGANPSTDSSNASSDSAPVVDLIPMIDPDRDGVTGKWVLAANKLTSDETRFARLRIPYQPPPEYDFLINFERLSGDNDVTQIFSVGRNAVAWQMGGDNGRLWGFDQVMGEMLKVGGPPRIRNGQRYTSVVQVRKNLIRSYFEHQLLSQAFADPSDLSNTDRWSLGAPDLGLGTCAGSTRFHAIQIIVISGKGAPRQARLTPAPANTATVNLLDLIDLSQDRVVGVWESKDGTLRTQGGGDAWVSIPYMPPDEYDFRVTFARAPGGIDAVSPYFVHRGRGAIFHIGAWRNTITGFHIIADRPSNQNSSTLRQDSVIDSGRKYTCIVQVRKGSISAYLEGKLMARHETDYSDLKRVEDWGPSRATPGLASWYTPVVFYAAEVVEIGGKGKMTRSSP